MREEKKKATCLSENFPKERGKKEGEEDDIVLYSPGGRRRGGRGSDELLTSPFSFLSV